MGITYINGFVRGPSGEVEVRFLVDSGVTYTLLPENIWKTIGLEPKRYIEFSLADGTLIKRAVSECSLSIPQGEGHTPVIPGEADDEALLGVVTFFNPLKRILQPLRAILV